MEEQKQVKAEELEERELTDEELGKVTGGGWDDRGVTMDEIIEEASLYRMNH